MVQDMEKQKVTYYKVGNKTYKVTAKCIENTQSVDKLYDILCKYAIKKLNANVWFTENTKIYTLVIVILENYNLNHQIYTSQKKRGVRKWMQITKLQHI